MKYFKCVFLGVTLIFLISLVFVFNKDYITMDYSFADIDGDKRCEKVILKKKIFSKYGSEVIIYSSEGEELYREDFSDLKPWKIAVGDVDGDGINEVSIGVYKETIFHPVMDKRPFIYTFKDNRLHPKWRGSRLSRPFTDYLFYDIDNDGMDEIIAIEFLKDGQKAINTYKWKGFGFEGLLESEGYKDIGNLQHRDGLIYVDVKGQKDSFKGVLKLKDNKLLLERVNKE